MKSCVLLAGLAPRARPWCASRCSPGATPRSSWPGAGPTSPRRTTTAPTWCGSRPSTLSPFELDVPGDPSQAAFWVVAALRRARQRGHRRAASTWGRAGAGFLDVLRAHGGATSRRCPPPGPATWPPPPTSRPASGRSRATEVDGGGDHRPRRGPGAGRGGGLRRGRHRVPGRGGAAGEGVRPPGGRGRAGARPSGPGPRSTATTWSSHGAGRAVAGRRRRPRRPPHGHGRGGGRAWRPGRDPAVTGWDRLGGHQLPGLRRRTWPRSRAGRGERGAAP